MKITTLLVDDEPKSNFLLQSYLEKYCPDIDVVGAENTVDEAEKFIIENQPQLLFLDISMPGGGGFELLNRFNNNSTFNVVFVTAHDEYALKAFQFAALHYLLKPIDVNELIDAVERFKNEGVVNLCRNEQVKLALDIKESKSQKKIVLSSLGGYDLVDTDSIVFCEADGSYTYFYFKEREKKMISQNIGFYENLLPKEIFFRVHKKYLINLNYVKFISKGKNSYIELLGGKKVLLSRRKKEAFRKALKSL